VRPVKMTGGGLVDLLFNVVVWMNVGTVVRRIF
jgi:hypothetical protein